MMICLSDSVVVVEPEHMIPRLEVSIRFSKDCSKYYFSKACIKNKIL